MIMENVKGILSINTSVKEVTESLTKTKMGQLNDIWIFDSFGNAIVNPNKEQTPEFDIESFRK